MLGLKTKLEHPWLCPGGFSKREVESRPRLDVPPATAVLLVVRSAGHPLCVTSLLSGLGSCPTCFYTRNFIHPHHLELFNRNYTETNKRLVRGCENFVNALA